MITTVKYKMYKTVYKLSAITLLLNNQESFSRPIKSSTLRCDSYLGDELSFLGPFAAIYGELIIDFSVI